MPTAGGFPYTGDYDRLIELYDTDGETLIEVLSSIEDDIHQVADASFEWLRLGGCGGGSITLNRGFDLAMLETGQWIKMSYKDGTPWYFGRVESWDAKAPVGCQVSLYGPLSVLNDLQVGGQGSWDTRNPHTYAKGDYFVNDPDHSAQSFTSVQDYDSLIRNIHRQYIEPYNGNLFPLGDFSAPLEELDFTSMTFRGEESVSSILRSISDMCYGSSYGIKPDKSFYFIPKAETVLATYQEGSHMQELSRSEDRSLMFNRMTLVGGYIYGEESQAGFFRWVSTHFREDSMNEYGAKQLRIYLPWVRTISEATNFADGFFDKYAGPTTRYSVTTHKQGAPLFPWEGYVELIPRTGADWAGATTIADQIDKVDVSFNEAPQFSFTTGPEELQYPQEPEAQRWETGEGQNGGDLGNVSDDYSFNFSFSGSSFFQSGSGPSDGSEVSDGASDYPSGDASDFPSQGASNFPSDGASNYPSAGASNYPTDGLQSYVSDGASDYPSANASDFPSADQSNYPSEGASNYPTDGLPSYHSDGDSHYPSEGASDFPSQNQSNFPSDNASNYPSSHASNYPTDGPGGACDVFVCEVVQDGCTITGRTMTAAEAGAIIAAAMEGSPVLSARIAAAVAGYL